MKQKDLQIIYGELRHYFSKDMPKHIDIKITSARSYVGCALWDDNGKDMAIYIGKPALMRAERYGMTWENTLMHEMCHIWERINSPKTISYVGRWGGHSGRFFDKLRAVETLTGIKQFWDFDPEYYGK